jgi:hypothetical protein
MFASGILGLLMGVLLSLYVFTMKSLSGVSEQLQLDREAGTVDFIARDIKAAQLVAVGSYDGTSFVPIPMGDYLRGKALSVLVADSVSPPVQVYYWIDTRGRLLRETPALNQSKQLVRNVTNDAVFAITDSTGNVLSNFIDRLSVRIELSTRDENVQNFRQTMNIHTTVTKRN